MDFDFKLQQQDFDLAAQYEQLRAVSPQTGAIVTFSGLVREMLNDKQAITCLELSSYEGLINTQIETVKQELQAKYDVNAVHIIHRYGQLKPLEQIVYVGAASAHRQEAFLAAQFAMDFLKSQIALWKKEYYSDTEDDYQWIEPTAKDYQALGRGIEKQQ